MVANIMRRLAVLLFAAALVDRASAACGSIAAGCVAGKFCDNRGVQTCKDCAVRKYAAAARSRAFGSLRRLWPHLAAPLICRRAAHSCLVRAAMDRRATTSRDH